MKTYGTLKMKMFQLSTQSNFYFLLSSYVEDYVKKESILNFMSSVLVSWSPKSRYFFGKFTIELVWKSFSGRNNSLEPSVFWFSNGRLYDLEESIKRVESFVWIDFGVNRHSNMPKKIYLPVFFFFCVSEPPLWIYEFLWNTKFCFFYYHPLRSFKL